MFRQRFSKRTIISTIVATAILAGLTATAVAQSQFFSDVVPDHQAYDAIKWAYAKRITVGYEDGTFRPAEPLNRWHAGVFMDRYYDEVLGANGEASFASDNFTRADMMQLLYAMNEGDLYDIQKTAKVTLPSVWKAIGNPDGPPGLNWVVETDAFFRESKGILDTPSPRYVVLQVRCTEAAGLIIWFYVAANLPWQSAATIEYQFGNQTDKVTANALVNRTFWMMEENWDETANVIDTRQDLQTFVTHLKADTSGILQVTLLDHNGKREAGGLIPTHGAQTDVLPILEKCEY